MKTHRFLMTLILLAGLLLGACTPEVLPPPGQPTALPGSPTPGEAVSSTPTPAAVAAAVQALAARLAVDASFIQVASVEAVDWPDGCLGAGAPSEACPQVVTRGYRIVLTASGRSYEYHTNLSGTSVRLAAAVVRDIARDAAVLAARQFLAKILTIGLGAVTLVSADAASWTDTCMGVPSGLACIITPTPGYKVVLSAGGKSYELHVAASGDRILVVGGAPLSQQPAIQWQSADLPCQLASITSQGVSYGECQRALTPASFANPERAAHLDQLTAAYRSFSAATLAGAVVFTGAGAAVASPAEQRAIAEWAKLVFMEAEGGRSSAAWGLAFSWHRAGGIAGFCDDLGVYYDGAVTASSCRGQTLANGGHFYLDAGQLAQLYAWTDRLQPFEADRSNPPGTADGMTLIVTFAGTGKTPAAQSDQDAILAFASALFQQAATS